MPAPIAYPRRPRFFANRFCRLMTKVCLANEIGPEACYLLTTIAMTEDAKSYRGAVTYWNEQLVPLVGLNNVKSLDRVRGRAVEAGWLHYTPGGKGRPGAYWVVIPADFCGMDDVPTDEDATEYLPTLLDKIGIVNGIQVGNKAGEKRETNGKKAGEKRDTSGQHSSLSFPLPVLREESGEPEEPASPPPVAVLTYPTIGVGPKEWPLTEAMISEWGTAYPGVDVLAECRKALAWVNANPTKRKTAKGMPTFLVKWIGRANDSGRAARPQATLPTVSSNGTTPAPIPPPLPNLHDYGPNPRHAAKVEALVAKAKADAAAKQQEANHETGN